MIRVHSRATGILPIAFLSLLLSANPAISGDTGVCCDPDGCFESDGCSTGTFIENVTCSSSPCCGDGACAADEDSCSCPSDCQDDPDSCSVCECGGSGGNCGCDSDCYDRGDCCANACAECLACGSVCDNGLCGPDEDNCSCPFDCPDPNPDLCDPCECGTASSNCFCDTTCVVSQDCCSNVCLACGICGCGDGFCDTATEDQCTCPSDCPDPNPDLCDPCECGGSSSDGTCWCDDICATKGDCCDNACDECGECGPACGDGFCDTAIEDQCACPEDCADPNPELCDPCECGGSSSDGTCWCDDICAKEGDCCDNACDECGQCPVPTGACCVPDGGCTETTQIDCGGSYQGDGSSCKSTVCGACCLERAPTAGIGPGGVCLVMSEDNCGDFTGDFQGGGTNCDPNPCPQPTGACCFEAGTCGTRTSAECDSEGGTYQGDGTTCDPNPCPPPTGACCLPEGSCTETTQGDCGGSYQGDGSSCASTVCGACCFARDPNPGRVTAGIGPGSLCFVVSEIFCTSFGGNFQGQGTGCDPNPCPQPTGACCLPFAPPTAGAGTGPICTLLTESECGLLSGTPDAYQGDGTVCDPNPCPQPPTGACCFPEMMVAGNGVHTGCEIQTDADCTAFGGTYQGDGTDCDPNPCPAPTVCGNANCEVGENCTSCLQDCPCGPCETCVAGTCNTNCGDGTCDPACGECTDCFQDCGASCGDDVCTSLCENCDNCFQDCFSTCTGACCFPGGECTGETTETDCQSQGGSFQGVGSLCGSTVPNCPQPPVGACCVPDGSCIDAATETACLEQSGVWQGGSSACETTVCPQPGACCHEGKGVGCVETTVSACKMTLGGVFLGGGTTCDPNPCQPEACCFFDGGGGGFTDGGESVAGTPPGSCDTLRPDLCLGAGGVPQGAGSTCDPNPCVSACCFSSGVCSVLPTATCEASGGTPGAAGSNCTPNLCPAPACCLPGGSCEQMLAGACTANKGTPQKPGSTCEPNPCTVPIGACCLGEAGRTTAGSDACLELTEVECRQGFLGTYLGDGTSCAEVACNPERVDISTKGSLLIFSNVELQWSFSAVAGTVATLTTDTVISLTNDYPREVYVQMYFINGDPELDPLFAGTPPTLVREGEPGCNWVDCQLLLTPDQPIYWSAATGNPAGCQPFSILDPDLGTGPGRPNPDVRDGSRVLRGYVIAWAVDETGREINWNHLSGKATIVDYATQSAWEYEAWAFQALENLHGEPLPESGALQLDGLEYEQAFDMLLYDFFAAGSQAMSSGPRTVVADGDLTLHPVTVDLRQEHDEPVTTKAHFDIWNMNERKLSNTRRCVTCWDQSLLSLFNPPNTFLLANLQSDKGKARIDGKQADECEENCFRDELGNPLDLEDLFGLLDDLFEDVDIRCSQDAALLGVASKILTFSGLPNQRALAGSPLVGMGVERARIQYDLIAPPGSLREQAFQRIGRELPREHDRLDAGKEKPRG